MPEHDSDEGVNGIKRGPCPTCTHFSGWYGEAKPGDAQVVICEKDGRLRINTTPCHGCMQWMPGQPTPDT